MKEDPVAQRTTVVLIDDIDGSPADETVKFALDGVDYEIDLNDTHAAAMRESLTEWVSAARRTSGRRAPRRGRNAASAARPTTDVSDIREWARQKGFEVSDRGRIPTTVRDAYDRAH